MAKNKKEKAPAIEKDDVTITAEAVVVEKPARPPRRTNALLVPWLLIFLCTAASLVGVAGWLQYRFAPDNDTIIVSTYKDLYRSMVSQTINTQLKATTDTINAIAANPDVTAAMAQQDPATTLALSSHIASALPNSVSLQFIPWDLTGTAALKDHNITLRNNIELMLVSQAGGKKNPAPEAYQHDGKWLISFTAPIIQNESVIGVILATFSDKYLANLANLTSITGNAKITLTVKNSQIFSLGNGSAEHEEDSVGFTDGKVAIDYNADRLGILKRPLQPVHMVLGGVIVFLLLLILIGLGASTNLARKDAQSIVNYTDSLGALHKTSQPALNIPALSPILASIDALGARTTKTAITAEVREDYKSPQATARVPEKLAVPTVAEKNHFDHPEIFRDYDIRGLADSQLNSDSAVMIGKAIGSHAVANGINTIVMGRDGRTSSERLQYDVSRGILSTGCDVVNIGQVPSPVLYYATEKLGTGSGIMVTGSHNPPEYNGLKIVLGHKTLQGVELKGLLHRIENYEFATGQGKITKQEIDKEYIEDVSTDIIIARPLNVVVDAGNGVGGDISTRLLAMLDCQVTPLFCDVDGKFPNRGPDPSIRVNLTDLINKVQETGADLGIAFDGDADRVVVVTSSGQVIGGDKLLMLFARDIVSRNAGCSIVYDVKCSRNVERLVSSYGGRAIMAASGHSNLKAKMQETEALLGGELTGHYYFHERWNGFDDAIYAALRLMEILSTGSTTLDEEIASLPESPATPELHIPVSNHGQAEQIVGKLHAVLGSSASHIDTTDGIRAEFTDGWGLVRPSNTSSSLSLRFEADSEEALARIQDTFRTAINGLNLNLTLPF